MEEHRQGEEIYPCPSGQDQLGLDHFSASGKVERELRREISAATGLVERRGKSHLQTVF